MALIARSKYLYINFLFINTYIICNEFSCILTVLILSCLSMIEPCSSSIQITILMIQGAPMSLDFLTPYGPEAEHCSLPLGGLGAGMISFAHNGALESVSIQHRPAMFHHRGGRSQPQRRGRLGQSIDRRRGGCRGGCRQVSDLQDRSSNLPPSAQSGLPTGDHRIR